MVSLSPRVKELKISVGNVYFPLKIPRKEQRKLWKLSYVLALPLRVLCLLYGAPLIQLCSKLKTSSSKYCCCTLIATKNFRKNSENIISEIFRYPRSIKDQGNGQLYSKPYDNLYFFVVK